MKRLLAFISILALASCEGDPIQTEHHGDFQVELLFEHDGCKMYRFEDDARNVYWSDCAGKTQRNYTTQSGKTTVTHHEETLTTE